MVRPAAGSDGQMEDVEHRRALGWKELNGPIRLNDVLARNIRLVRHAGNNHAHRVQRTKLVRLLGDQADGLDREHVGRFNDVVGKRGLRELPRDLGRYAGPRAARITARINEMAARASPEEQQQAPHSQPLEPVRHGIGGWIWIGGNRGGPQARDNPVPLIDTIGIIGRILEVDTCFGSSKIQWRCSGILNVVRL